MSGNRAFTRAVRARAERTGEPYTVALRSVTTIREIAEAEDVDLVKAEGIHDDPANQIACGRCGWTNGMLCPECPGCGCYNSSCSGWRHREFMDEDERRALDTCPDCGGDTQGDYGCTCDEPF